MKLISLFICHLILIDSFSNQQCNKIIFLEILLHCEQIDKKKSMTQALQFAGQSTYNLQLKNLE